MNLLFRAAANYTPDFVKKMGLTNLFRITASAFGGTMPSIARLSFEDCLTEFARFTKAEVDKAIANDKDLGEIQSQLYNGAYNFGGKFRRLFQISTIDDVIEASRFLYSFIGIDFRGAEQGTITISKCFFSQQYSASTCRVISSMDAGLVAGLSKGKGIEFSQRITEGAALCKARLLVEEALL